MSDTLYTNGVFQLGHLSNTLRQAEEALAMGIHDTHDRLEMEQHAEQLRADLAKLLAWEDGQAKIRKTDEQAKGFENGCV